MNKKILNLEFAKSEDEFKWTSKMLINDKEIDFVVTDCLFDSNLIESKILKINGALINLLLKKCTGVLICLSKEVYNDYKNIESEFILTSIKLDIDNVIQLDFYLYLKNLDEGDNTGVWTAYFQNDMIIGVRRRQY